MHMRQRLTELSLSPGVIAALATMYLVWGSTYLAIRFAIATIPPLLMAGLRFLFAGLLLYTVTRLRGSPRPKAAYWRSASIIGGLLLLGGNGGVVIAEQSVPSGIVALLIAVTPLWMVFLEWLRPGGLIPTRRVIMGVLLGIVGIALLVGPSLLSAGHGKLDPLMAAVVLLGSLAWSAGSIYSRYAPMPESSLQGTALEMLAGGALLLLAGSASGEWAKFSPEHISTASVLAVAYLVIFGSLITYSAYTWLLKQTTPAVASTYAFVNPAIAVLLGWALAGEELSFLTLLAAAVIITAVVLITTSRMRPK